MELLEVLWLQLSWKFQPINFRFKSPRIFFKNSRWIHWSKINWHQLTFSECLGNFKCCVGESEKHKLLSAPVTSNLNENTWFQDRFLCLGVIFQILRLKFRLLVDICSVLRLEIVLFWVLLQEQLVSCCWYSTVRSWNLWPSNLQNLTFLRCPLPVQETWKRH